MQMSDRENPHRPLVHFTPQKGFMNDPNGLFRGPDGTWHLYYQYNPAATVIGNQHWGHATSTDLYHWVDHPIAIVPPNAQSQVYSGSAVIDPDNTSGFFPGQKDGVVAVYTLNTKDRQIQAISYSRDGGYAFEAYEGNPIIDVNLKDFRDPKVIRYDDHWVMVVAYSLESKLGFYTSHNLKTWESTGYLHLPVVPGQACECPCLVRIPLENPDSAGAEDAKWVLFVSFNPGMQGGGSCVRYLTGAFDGRIFQPGEGSHWRDTDLIGDEYATQFFHNTGNEAISISWAHNLQYSIQMPTKREGWVSAMTLPRRIELAIGSEGSGYQLKSMPVELDAVKGRCLRREKVLGAGEIAIDTGHYGAQAVCLTISMQVGHGTSKAGSGAALDVSLASISGGERIRAGHQLKQSGLWELWFDRSRTSKALLKDRHFKTKFSSTQTNLPEMLTFILDRSIMEVFSDSGLRVGTMLYFTEEPLSRMRLRWEGGGVDSEMQAELWTLVK